MQQKVFDIQGMTCAACAVRVEKAVGKLPGVDAVVNLANETLTIQWPDGEAVPDVLPVVQKAGYQAMERTALRKVVIPVGGMTCAACSARVEKALNALPGVTAQVNLATEKATATYDPVLTRLSDLRQAIAKAGYQALAEEKVDENRLRKEKEMRVMRIKLVIALAFTIPLFYLAMGPMIDLPVPGFLNADVYPLRNALTQLVLVLPVMAAGYRFYVVGFRALFLRAPNMDSLVAMGTSAAFLYSVYGVVRIMQGDHHAVHSLYFESTAVIIALIMLGKTLEAMSKGRTGDAIRKLMKLAPATAVLVTQGGEKEIPVDEVEPGDNLLVRPGARVPVDGVVVSGQTAVDESMLTGESMPRDKAAGDRMYAGTMNAMGLVTMRADKVGEDTALSQIIKLVEEAQGNKAPIAQLADKVSAVFVPVVALIAVIAGIAWFIAGSISPQVVTQGMTPAGFALTVLIAVLVIACPCALGLATPTAIMVGTGK
ncbi:MAG: heavy metal translocating P-type ATPase, partial [Clostridiales bacterium]|nr:heavy metal translocating P-type ATPase [Clostridiales bacterium]